MPFPRFRHACQQKYRHASALSSAALLFIGSTAVLHAQVGEAPPPVRGPSSTPLTDLQLSYGVSTFRDDTPAWHLASAGLHHRRDDGSYLARLNYAHRFGEDGVQLEVDAYPRITAGTYGYLNVGRGFSGNFPEWRFGAELFTALAGPWEVSGGFRELQFAERGVTLLTGSVGHYFGNSWISLRPWAQLRNKSITVSATLMARNYFADADNFLGGRIGYGSTPSEQLTLDVIDRTRAWSAALEGSHSLAQRLVGTWSAGYESEELAARRTRSRFEITAGLRASLQ
jgi:YaiO family outer membrane protein